MKRNRHASEGDRSAGALTRVATWLCLCATAALAQPPKSLQIFNAASGAATVAPNSIASAFGRQIGSSTAQATSLPLPTLLGGVSVDVVDSAKATRSAPLFYVSPNQINFVVPDGVAKGTTTITVMGRSDSTTSSITVAAVAPGIFTANGNGVGVAAAIAIRRIIATQTDTQVPVYQCNANGCSSTGITMSPDAQVFLELFGTGIRGRTSLANVKATIGGESADVLFAGPQGEFPGLDQVNLLLPQTLHAEGETDVILTVDGQIANKVRVNLHRGQ